MLKKLLSLTLIVCALFVLGSCAEDKYPPVESTAEESRVVYTLTLDGERYDVKYELYRAFFLNYKSIVDGGNESVWQGDGKYTYVTKINEMILDSVCEIYGALHHAKAIGINPYSTTFDKKIDEYIAGSVEGYNDGTLSAEGFGGDYDKYLESLKKNGLNYSTQVLLYRYAIAVDKINEHYIGTVDLDNPTPDMQSGALKYTREDLRSYYDSNDTVRCLLAVLDSRSFTAERANEIRDNMASYANEAGVISYIMNFTTTTERDGAEGVIIGKNSLDGAYYSGVTEQAFSISIGEVSQVVPVSNTEGSYYYILYKVAKTDEYFNGHIADITSSYLNSQISRLLSLTEAALVESATPTSEYSVIDHSAIAMP